MNKGIDWCKPLMCENGHVKFASGHQVGHTFHVLCKGVSYHVSKDSGFALSPLMGPEYNVYNYLTALEVATNIIRDTRFESTPEELAQALQDANVLK